MNLNREWHDDTNDRDLAIKYILPKIIKGHVQSFAITDDEMFPYDITTLSRERFMHSIPVQPMKNSTVEVTAEGNIIVSGLTIMSGYVADEGNTRKVLKDGKIYGSDLGYVDDEGLIHLKGRQGDVINVGGFKVDPSEVENAAASHDSVKDCICIAGTHPVIGTVLKLLVVLADGASLDKRSLALHLKSKLEPHKIPTYYEAVESIQRTYNGKLDRKFYKK